MTGRPIPKEIRFWRKVDRRGPDECWPWLGALNPKGYGYFYPMRGKAQMAHRASWEMANGETIPPGLFGCHSCDNPGCVNPSHIWLGTHQQNMADMRAKGNKVGVKRTTVCPLCLHRFNLGAKPQPSNLRLRKQRSFPNRTEVSA